MADDAFGFLCQAGRKWEKAGRSYLTQRNKPLTRWHCDLPRLLFGHTGRRGPCGEPHLYVINLFTAGFPLSHYFSLLHGIARVAYALYFSSMLAAFGLLHASQSTLLCSAYTSKISTLSAGCSFLSGSLHTCLCRHP
jgi:hypothetical protein